MTHFRGTVIRTRQRTLDVDRHSRRAARGRQSGVALLPALLGFLLASLPAAGQTSGGTQRAKPQSASAEPRGVAVVHTAGYPELRVDGRPFFIHSASFLYYRIPDDLWELSLDRHRELGLNTVVLPIPWNWHEPRPGALDFDGHSNPRRDLRRLLRLIAEKRIRLVAFPGPHIGDAWMGGGVPDGSNAEAAQKWLGAVARELAPYSAKRSVTVSIPGERRKKADPTEEEIGGPLLFVLVEGIDPLAAREALSAAGAEVLGLSAPGSSSGNVAGSAIGRVGRWRLSIRPSGNAEANPALNLSEENVSELELLAAQLQTQLNFPALVADFRTGAPAPADDVRPPETSPDETLLSSRLLLAQGVAGVNYWPAQDSVTPAGYGEEGGNWHYRWDAALDANANRQPRARALARNGQLLSAWEELLAGANKRADFGIVLTTGQRAASASGLPQTIKQLLHQAHREGLAVTFADPAAQPVEQLLRNRLLLLPPDTPLSEPVERALVEYVRRGGTLALSTDAASPRTDGELETAVTQARDSLGRLGQGAFLELASEFFPGEKPAEANPAGAQEAGSQSKLEQLVERGGVRRSVRRTSVDQQRADLLVSQLVSHAGTGLVGSRSGGRGLLSVTNLSAETIEETVEILSPRAGAPGTQEEYISLPLNVPGHESLLLPLHYPLCSEPAPRRQCTDEIIAAGAEFLGAEREGRTLELTFYAPARATILLRLEQQPRRVTLDEMKPEALWTQVRNELSIVLMRGAAPDYLRTVKIHLRYRPHVPEKPDPRKGRRRDYDFSITGNVRLPFADDASLASFPPLVTVEPGRDPNVLVQATNYDELGRDLNVKIEGDARASGSVGLAAGETRISRLTLKSMRETGVNGDGSRRTGNNLLQSELEVRAGRDRRAFPIFFAVIPEEGATTYRYDFDRDGGEEWVLENKGLRIIISPQMGGRALAIVDKLTGANFTTSVGAFGAGEGPAGDRTGHLHTPHLAEWANEESHGALRLRGQSQSQSDGAAAVDKTIRLTSAESFEVDYQWTPAASSQAEAVLEATHSLPVRIRGQRSTRFCWEVAPQSPPAEGSRAEMRCELFQPRGPELKLPAEVRRLEIHTPGRPGLAAEWSGGGVAIEMKSYSALLVLRFPSMTSEAGGEKQTVRYTLLAGE